MGKDYEKKFDSPDHHLMEDMDEEEMAELVLEAQKEALLKEQQEEIDSASEKTST